MHQDLDGSQRLTLATLRVRPCSVRMANPQFGFSEPAAVARNQDANLFSSLPAGELGVAATPGAAMPDEPNREYQVRFRVHSTDPWQDLSAGTTASAIEQLEASLGLSASAADPVYLMIELVKVTESRPLEAPPAIVLELPSAVRFEPNDLANLPPPKERELRRSPNPPTAGPPLRVAG